MVASHETWKKLASTEIKSTDLNKLDWRPLEGFYLKPLYTSTVQNLSLPGTFPYTRGVKATMYTGRPWTIRQYAGFSTAAATNAFFHTCLKDGQKGLSVAFDLATHRGYDSDHPRVIGDVGKAGVAIDTVEDMKCLFSGIPLNLTSVSMTMNGAVISIMAFYIVAAEEYGFSINDLSGTIQNDILKEFLVRNTYIYPPEPSMRIVGDVIAYCCEKMPKFNPISISGYHLHEAGATAAQELAYTLANGLEYVRKALTLGLEIDQFAPRLSFFFGIGMNFFMEIAKLRAARTLWAELMQQFSPSKPESSMLRMHCQTSGVSLTVQDPQNNIVRTTIEALAAVLGGTQSLHTNAFDEALSLPTEESARIARHTQLIIAEETNITKAIDPLGGSYYIETLTEELIQAAKKLMTEVEDLGGMTKAIQLGSPKVKIEQTSALRQIRWDTQQDIIVGVNKYASSSQTDVPVLDIDTEFVRTQQVTQLQNIKATRNAEACTQALEALRVVAQTSQGNLLEAAVEAARARATLGEISDIMESAFGRYHPPLQAVTGVWYKAMEHQQDFQLLRERIAKFAEKEGRQPRILLVKLGQDGHDRGIKIIASAFADCGFDVDLAPLFLTPEEAAKQAIENDVHFIGISSLAAGHKSLIPVLINTLNHHNACEIQVICGGILPPQDHAFLKEAGVKLIFTPGSKVLDIISQTLTLLESSSIYSGFD